MTVQMLGFFVAAIGGTIGFLAGRQRRRRHEPPTEQFVGTDEMVGYAILSTGVGMIIYPF